MTFLPIVDRELRVASRLTATYRNRALTVGLVAALAILMLVFGSPRSQGVLMFAVMSGLALVFCLLEGVRKTADCLSQEKREGTLGLLFLTDLKGYDIVFGKLAAMSLNSFYGLLSILPLLAFPLLLGGVTPGEYWRMALALLNILFFSLCLGLFVSSVTREPERAQGGALIAIILICGGPALLPIHFLWPFSPTYAFTRAFETGYSVNAGGYWKSLVLSQVASWAFLVVSVVVVPGSWQERAVAKRGKWWQRPGPKQTRRAARQNLLRLLMLERNPILWLAGRERSLGFMPIVYFGVVLMVLGSIVLSFNLISAPVYLGVAWVLNFVLKMRIAAQACHCMAQARRCNALEMLMVTPLTATQIIQGQVQALRRLYFAPVVGILTLQFAGLILGVALANSGNNTNRVGEIASLAFFLGIGYAVIFLLDLVAVTWAGMWFGLTSKKEGQAVSKTVLCVLLAPLLSVVFYFFSAFFFFAWPLFWILWTPSRLRSKLREQSEKGYSLGPVSLRVQSEEAATAA